MRLLFDCEADGFLEVVTRVHCIGAVDVDTGKKFVWGPNEIEQALAFLAAAEELIGHNIIRYDLPVLAKLHGFVFTGKVTDTLVMARVAFPAIRESDAELLACSKLPRQGSDGTPLIGKHNLEAWGYRLGERKQHFEGPWEVWTQAMQDYMMQDVASNYVLYKHLIKQKVPQLALDLEHRIAELCDIIEKEGCPFDTEAAGKLHAMLVGKRDALERELRMQFEPWLAPDGPKRGIRTPKRKPNKNQDYTWWDGALPGEVTYTKLKRVFFNPGSRDHIIRVLKRIGWKPVDFTDAGKPKVDETVVEGLVKQFPEVTGLGEFLMIGKRLQQLADGEQAWLKHVDKEGKIHGVVNPMGAVTSRATHFNPNLGQVPSAKKPYGQECRDLFGPLPAWGGYQIGADMEGLELRGLAHYLALTDDGEYGKVVTTGDPHWLNAQGMGLVPLGTVRDGHNPLHTVVRESGSKRFIYAYIYGAGDEKAGRIILQCVLDAKRQCGSEGQALFQEWFKTENPSEAALKKVGKRVRTEFAKRIRGFGNLKERIKVQVERHGYVPALDGRRIPTRSEHSALNFMIQSAGAILCKRWGVDAFDEIRSKYKIGWSGDVCPMLWVHDEYQYAAKKGLEKEVGEILVKHARLAGDPYKFRVPLDSKYKIGKSWKDCH